MDIATIILGLIIFALLGIVISERISQRKERERFINALIARNASEYQSLERDEMKQQAPPQQKPDIIPEAELSDRDFANLIKKSLE